jgi:hypothetical protein
MPQGASVRIAVSADERRQLVRHFLTRIRMASSDGHSTRCGALGDRPRRTPLGIGVLALYWALSLGQGAAAGNPAAREEGSPAGNSVQTGSTGRAQTGFPDSMARLGNGWRLRSHKPHHAFPKITLGDDPNDNETSDDPNDDDDAWDDLSAVVDRDAPTIGWLWETMPCQNAPQCAPVIRTLPPTSPFLTQQRLRC